VRGILRVLPTDWSDGNVVYSVEPVSSILREANCNFRGLSKCVALRRIAKTIALLSSNEAQVLDNFNMRLYKRIHSHLLHRDNHWPVAPIALERNTQSVGAGAVTVWIAVTVSVTGSISVITAKDVTNVVCVSGTVVVAVVVAVAGTTTTAGVTVAVIVADVMLRHLHCSVNWEAGMPGATHAGCAMARFLMGSSANTVIVVVSSPGRVTVITSVTWVRMLVMIVVVETSTIVIGTTVVKVDGTVTAAVVVDVDVDATAVTITVFTPIPR
jgi:hypothetical protein